MCKNNRKGGIFFDIARYMAMTVGCDGSRRNNSNNDNYYWV